MTRRKRLTPEQQAEAAERREAGEELNAIAKAMNCTFGSVQWACLKLGAELPTPHRLKLKHHVQNPVVMRGGHIVRAFTPDEDRQILALEAQGLGDKAIGLQLNPQRKPNSVRCRLMALARRDERAAAATSVKRTTPNAATAAPHSMEPA